MKKLPIDIVILSWNSSLTLRNTLNSYKDKQLFSLVENCYIVFQEISEDDFKIANEFGLNIIGNTCNVGIGKGFLQGVSLCTSPYIILLEHDWLLIEELPVVLQRLQQGIEKLEQGYTCIKYRHRTNPGHPLHTLSHKGREVESLDGDSGYTGVHLLDSLHWTEPDTLSPDKIKKCGEWFETTSRWANFTNNPCLYKKDFYLNNIGQFAGKEIDLEGNIAKWWVESEFKVAQGEGLFTHYDPQKYTYN